MKKNRIPNVRYTIVQTDEGVLAIYADINYIVIKKNYPEMIILETNVLGKDIDQNTIKFVGAL